MRANRLAVFLGTASMIALGFHAPADAAGGPPTLADPTPDPVAVDGSLTVTGTGCDASSPVSFYVWKTTGGAPYYLHSSGTGWTADGAGAFNRAIPLENRYPGGTELGVAASCTSVYDSDVASWKFVRTTLPDPEVDLVAPTRAGYGSKPKVRVNASEAIGLITLTSPGQPTQTSGGSAWGPVDFTLPAILSIGSHTYTATFDPSAEGAPTVTDTATIVITKATSTTALTRIGAGKIKPGKKVKVRVVLASTGPRTGVVVIKDDRTIRKTIIVRAADNGRKVVWVKLPTKGLRALTARYAGNRLTKPSLSPKVFVRVKR